MTPQERKKIQIESILIIDFFNEYYVFEQLVKSLFQKKIVEVDHKYKSKLYFYHGVSAGNSYVNYNKQCIELNPCKYIEGYNFNTLQINKINNFLKIDNIIDELNFSINSIQRATMEISFNTCCDSLIKMRNCFAHEIKKVNFKETDIIELLNISKIKERLSKWYEEMLDDEISDTSKAIASNIVYMRIIIDKLKELNSELK